MWRFEDIGSVIWLARAISVADCVKQMGYEVKPLSGR